MNPAKPWTGALLAIAAICAGFSTGLAACGSDSFTSGTSTDDGGADAATSTDGGSSDGSAGSDAANDCLKPPTSIDPTEAAFCAAFAHISSRCGDCSACRSQNVNTCDLLGASISASFRDGVVACQDQITCAEFESQGAMASNPCVLARIADGGLTSTQLQADATYCARCSDGGTGGNNDVCANYFGGTDAGGAAVGGLVVVASDSVVQKITNGCGACEPILYGGCTLSTFCANSPKDQCGTGICK